MEDAFVRQFFELRVGNRYQIRQFLGSGGFGQVFSGYDTITGASVAIKVGDFTVDQSFLKQEIEIFESLSQVEGFPRVFWSGIERNASIMVFELLGPNLEDLFQYCERKFSLKTTLMLMIQILTRLESFHSINYIHRDIKPENFLLGTGKNGNLVYMTDPGLAFPLPSEEQALESYPSPFRRPIKPIEPKICMIGTCCFASISGHYDNGQSRKDDLESLGYMMIYFLKGTLPWETVKASSRKEKYENVAKQKKAISVDELCAGLPDEFGQYMKYVHNLGEDDIPQYRHLREVFRRLFIRRGFVRQRFRLDRKGI